MLPAPRKYYVNRHSKRRLNGGSPVTVGITAIAEDHEAIVSCVDTRMTTATTSIDPKVGRKICAMRNWTILSSGTMCYAESLVDAFQALLKEAPDNDPPTIKRALELALLAELPKFSAANYLTPYGLDMAAFLASRKSKGFSDERWNELTRSILEYSDKYDVELIVSGWGQTQEAFSATPSNQANGCIFSVDRSGVTTHSDEGFYTCGTGSPSAHSILSFFNYEPRMTLAWAVYFVAAAKFMSERTEGVGKTTVMRIGRRVGDGEWKGYFIQPDELEQIRTLWEKTGVPRMSDQAEDTIVDMLRKHGPLKLSSEYTARTFTKVFGSQRTDQADSAESKD
jgi:hypothetical protein